MNYKQMTDDEIRTFINTLRGSDDTTDLLLANSLEIRLDARIARRTRRELKAHRAAEAARLAARMIR